MYREAKLKLYKGTYEYHKAKQNLLIKTYRPKIENGINYKNDTAYTKA